MKNISKCVLVSLTMDGDFHVVAEAGLSKVGVAFPCFDVFSGDGNATSSQGLQSQYVSVNMFYSDTPTSVCAWTNVYAESALLALRSD